MWVQAGVGRVSAGEKDIIMRPKCARLTPLPAVLYIHGYGSDALTWQTIPTRSYVVNVLADAGHTMLCADFGGTGTWGNDTVLSRITAAYTYAQTLPGVLPGGVILLAQSAGAQAAIAWSAANIAKVRCVIGQIPVINVQDVRDNRGYMAAIDSAYAGGYSDAAYGAAHSPYVIAGNGGLNDVPMQLWYGDSDTTAIPQYTQAMAVLANRVELHMLSGGHAESTVAQIDPNAVLAYIKAQA